MPEPLRCLLISSNTVTVPYPVYPLGMAHVAGALQDAGHYVRQHDVLVDGIGAALTELLRNFAPNLVGISIRNIDTVDSTDLRFFLGDALNCINTVRAHTDAPIVVGGSGFTIFPGEVMEALDADFGIVGEGETAICRLAADIGTGEAPQRGTLLIGEPIRTLRWPTVSYDPHIAGFYAKHGGMMNIQTKRGCPFRCGYCSYPRLEGSTYRHRDSEEVAAEVIRLHRDYGARYIFFADSVFNDAAGHFIEIAEELIRQRNPLPWAGYFRPKGLTAEIMDVLKRSGLHAIEFGTDATSDRTLSGMGKKFSMSDVYQSQAVASGAGIASSHFVIFGGPGENQTTLHEGIANMERLGDAVVFGFSGIRILPNTPIHAQAVREGIISGDQDILPPIYYYSPEVSPEDIQRQLHAAWAANPRRVFPVVESAQRIAPLHKMGFIGPLWDKI